MSATDWSQHADALEVLTTEHRALEHLFSEIEGQGVGPRREELVSELVVALRRHAAIEEEAFYPAIRDDVPGGDVLAYRGVEDHQGVDEALARLARLDPNDHESELVLKQLSTDVRRHLAEEESVLFPKVRATVEKERLSEIGLELAMAGRRFPSCLQAHASTRKD